MYFYLRYRPLEPDFPPTPGKLGGEGGVKTGERKDDGHLLPAKIFIPFRPRRTLVDSPLLYCGVRLFGAVEIGALGWEEWCGSRHGFYQR